MAGTPSGTSRPPPPYDLARDRARVLADPGHAAFVMRHIGFIRIKREMLFGPNGILKVGALTPDACATWKVGRLRKRGIRQEKKRGLQRDKQRERKSDIDIEILDNKVRTSDFAYRSLKRQP